MMAIPIFVLIALFGFILTFVISKDLEITERFGLSYLLGTGLITLLIFYYSWIGIKITSISILVLVILLILLTAILNLFLRRQIKLKIPNFRKLFISLKWYERLILSAIFVMLLLSFVIATYYPINVWDALALYDFRAKVIADLGYFVQIQGNFTYFSQYPLLTSLSHTIVYIFGGKNPQSLYPIYYISFSVIFYNLVRKNTGRLVSLLATLFLVTNPIIFQHSTIAYTNLPYTVFYVVGIIYLYQATIQNKYSFIALASLLLGLSTWVRADEPFWITGAFAVIVFAIYKKSMKPILIYFPIFLFIQQPWSFYASQLFGQSYSTAGQLTLAGSSIFSGINIGRFLDIITYVYKNVILPWGLLLVPFLIAVFLNIVNKFNKNQSIMLTIIIINLLGLFAGTYVFSLSFSDWKNIPDSASRLAMFFPPLMIYYCALVFDDLFNKNK